MIKLFFLIGLAMSEQKKRAAPETIPPIERSGIEYVHNYSHAKEETGEMDLLARRKADGAKIWSTVIFKVNYDMDKETDVQEIDLKSLSLVSNTLVAVDTKGQTYKLNASTGKLVDPPKTKVYDLK